jgi:assimilatory nitrate reductase catalytic subunit
MQGVFPLVGRGVNETVQLDDDLVYTVPVGCVAELIYFRAGNFCDDIIYLTVTLNSEPVRYFPVGPKADVHVPLAIVEQNPAGSRLEIGVGAPRGLAGSVVIDVGLLELPEGA